MSNRHRSYAPPRVCLLGDVDQAEFRDMVELVRATSQQLSFADANPDLVLIAAGRPGAVAQKFVDDVRRVAPTATIVAVLGTWCEGEARTGRPCPDVERVFWYNFSAWWSRRLAIRARGQVNDCFCVVSDVKDVADRPQSKAASMRRGLVAIRTPHFDTAEILNNVLRREGYATVWQQRADARSVVRGAAAGIWDGVQLNNEEADDLATFRRQLATDDAPILALLDFPRHERVEIAHELGATAVLGKPWVNTDLLAALQSVIVSRPLRRAA